MGIQVIEGGNVHVWPLKGYKDKGLPYKANSNQ